jgi:hypothetical protein
MDETLLEVEALAGYLRSIWAISLVIATLHCT